MAECQIPQMIMKNTVKPPDLVLVAGGQGALGGRLFYSLLKAEFNVRCLIRYDEEGKVDRKPGVEFFYCDPAEGDIPESAFEGVKFVVNAVSPLNTGSSRQMDIEGYERINNILITRSKSKGISRYLLLSSVFLSQQQTDENDWPNAAWRVEYSTVNSGIPYTILRSGIIVGGENSAVLHAIGRQGGLMSRLVKKVPDRLLVTPVEMIAEAFAKSLRIEQSAYRTYDVTLPEPSTRKSLANIAGTHSQETPWEAEVQPLLASSRYSGKVSSLEELEIMPKDFEVVRTA